MRNFFLAAICLALTFVACLTACSNDDLPEVNSAKTTTQVTPGKFGMFRIVDADGTVLGEFPCNITMDTVAKTRAWDGTYLMPNTQIRILSDCKVGSGYRHIRAVAYPVTMGYGEHDDRQVVGRMFMDLEICSRWLTMTVSNNFEGRLWSVTIYANYNILSEAPERKIRQYITTVVNDHNFHTEETRKYHMDTQWKGMFFHNYKTNQKYEVWYD